MVIVVGVAAMVWSDLSEFLVRVGSNRQNISDAEATAIARDVLGFSAKSATPFRNAGNRTQFIAVIQEVERDDGVASLQRVVILAGSGSVFTVTETALSWPVSMMGGADVSVIDVDSDGSYEVSMIWESSGSIGFTLQAALYDVDSSEVFALEADGYYESSVVNSEETTNLGARPEFADWLRSQVSERIGSDQEPDPYERENRAWISRHGRGYLSGDVDLEWTEDDIACFSSAEGELVDGRWAWDSCFKGSTIIRDSETASYAVAYVPRSPYDWIRSLIRGRSRIWTGYTRDGGLLTMTRPPDVRFETVKTKNLAGYPEGEQGRLVVCGEQLFLIVSDYSDIDSALERALRLQLDESIDVAFEFETLHPIMSAASPAQCEEALPPIVDLPNKDDGRDIREMLRNAGRSLGDP